MRNFRSFTYRPGAFLGTYVQISQPIPEVEFGAGAKKMTATEELSMEHAIVARILLAVDNVLARVDGRDNKDVSAIRQAALMMEDIVANHHMKYEEKYLYPKFKDTRLSDFVNNSIEQHRQMKDATMSILKRTMDGSVSGEKELAELRSECNSVRDLTLAHAAWEESVLFPEVYSTLSEDDIRDLNENMSKVEHELMDKGGKAKVFGDLTDLEKKAGTNDLSIYNLK